MALLRTARRGRLWFPALLLITGVGPFGLDTYLPALSSLGTSLHTGATGAQLTVTAYIVGLAVGQLTAGPISDSTGRRAVMLWSAVAFTLLSFACVVISTSWLFIAARLLQGCVAGAGVACGRAVLSDTYRGAAGDRRFGTLSAVNLLGPVVAPVIGAGLISVGGWRSTFVFMGALGVLVTVMAFFGVPESLPAGDRHAGGPVATWARMVDLVGDAVFRRHVLIACLATAGFFVYIGGSSYALQTVYALDHSRYAAVFTVNAIAMVIGSVTFRTLVGRWGPAALRVVGLVVAVTATVLLLVLCLVVHQQPGTLLGPWVLLSCVTFAMGLMNPAAMTLAQAAGDRARGTAAALQGGSMFLVGAAATPLVGILGYTSLIPMAAAMAALMATAGVVALATRAHSTPTAAPTGPRRQEQRSGEQSRSTDTAQGRSGGS